jgi:hypothetical protein
MFNQEFVQQFAKVVSDAIIAKMPGPRIAPRYMDYEQAGDYIGVSAEAIRAYIRQGSFRSSGRMASGGSTRKISIAS